MAVAQDKETVLTKEERLRREDQEKRRKEQEAELVNFIKENSPETLRVLGQTVEQLSSGNIIQASDDIAGLAIGTGLPPGPHSVPAYKKTSDGKFEINGPLTWEAFRNTYTYEELMWESPPLSRMPGQLALSGQASETMRRFSETLRQLQNDYNSGTNFVTMTTPRIMVESEITHDANGNEVAKPKHVLVAGLNTEHDTAKLQNIVVYNLRNHQRTSLGNFALEMPRTEVTTHDHALTQAHANEIAAKLYTTPEHGPDSPVVSRDGKSFAVAPMSMPQLEAHSMYQALPDATKAELQAQVAAKTLMKENTGTRFMIAGSVDPATGKQTPERLLMGGVAHPFAGGTGEMIYFDQSLNLKNNKTSTIEGVNPLTHTIPVKDGKISEKTAEEVIDTVKSLAEQHKISQAPRNPEFDALLAKGTTSAAREEEGVVVPSVPAVMSKARAV